MPSIPQRKYEFANFASCGKKKKLTLHLAIRLEMKWPKKSFDGHLPQLQQQIRPLAF